MKKIHEVNKEFQSRLDNINNKYGVFHAYSQEQFDKNINKELTPYLSFDIGRFVPEINYKKYIKEVESLWNWEKDYKVNIIGKKKLIQYELGNHGAENEGIKSTVDALEDYGITSQEVREEFRAYISTFSIDEW